MIKFPQPPSTLTYNLQSSLCNNNLTLKLTLSPQSSSQLSPLSPQLTPAYHYKKTVPSLASIPGLKSELFQDLWELGEHIKQEQNTQLGAVDEERVSVRVLSRSEINRKVRVRDEGVIQLERDRGNGDREGDLGWIMDRCENGKELGDKEIKGMFVGLVKAVQELMNRIGDQKTLTKMEQLQKNVKQLHQKLKNQEIVLADTCYKLQKKLYQKYSRLFQCLQQYFGVAHNYRKNNGDWNGERENDHGHVQNKDRIIKQHDNGAQQDRMYENERGNKNQDLNYRDVDQRQKEIAQRLSSMSQIQEYEDYKPNYHYKSTPILDQTISINREQPELQQNSQSSLPQLHQMPPLPPKLKQKSSSASWQKIQNKSPKRLLYFLPPNMTQTRGNTLLARIQLTKIQTYISIGLIKSSLTTLPPSQFSTKWTYYRNDRILWDGRSEFMNQGKGFKAGDIVQVSVNLEVGEIQWKVQKRVVYRMVWGEYGRDGDWVVFVSLGGLGDQVQVLVLM